MSKHHTTSVHHTSSATPPFFFLTRGTPYGVLPTLYTASVRSNYSRNRGRLAAHLDRGLFDTPAASQLRRARFTYSGEDCTRR